jgi:hypothetical protein
MSESEEKYSSYRSYYSSATTVYALLTGFTFTTISLLLTRLADPSQIWVQVTLLFLTVLLNVFLYSLQWTETAIENCIRVAPELPETWHRWKYARTIIAGTAEWGWRFSVVLMFLIWNMTHLAIASAIITVLFIVLEYETINKPYLEELKKKPLVRK